MIERLLSYISTSIVAVSFGEFRHGVELGISSRKLALIPNGATPKFILSREEARRNLGIGDATILFGFVGRMELQKNPIVLSQHLPKSLLHVPMCAWLWYHGSQGAQVTLAKASTRLG
jgi:hypothetical protein